MKIKLRDIIFWLLILSAIGVSVWLLIGSPTIETGLLMITIFIAGSEILLWQALFRMDKKTAIGFERIKNDINKLRSDLNYQLNEIKGLIKK